MAMKNIKYYISILAATALLCSCEDLLDSYPESEVSADEYITSTAALNSTVLGCYNAMQGVLNYEWAVTELRTDNTRMYGAGSTSNTTKALEYLDQGNIPSSSEYVNDYWDSSYAGIARCNLVLEKLGVADDETLRAQFEAEAKFLRAHFYFNLVRLWGPVFLVTKTTSAEEARYMQRTPVEDVYALIEGDLEAVLASEALPVKYAADQTGRATRVAAASLLAKVYMTHYQLGDEKYAKAAELLEDVIEWVGNPSDASKLVPFDKIFSIDNEMNDEIIFTCRYMSGNQGLGSPFGNYFAPVNNGANVIAGNANSNNYPSNDIINAFNANEGDLRKDVSLKERYFNEQTGVWVESGTCRYVNKFMSPVTVNYDGESDWPIIRVGDVVLLYAELLNELQGPSEKALGYLNLTRQRAGIPALTMAEVGSKYLFREAVRAERRLELAFENHRFFDLLRWGIAKETINDSFAVKDADYYATYSYVINPIDDWQLRLPIPQSVKDINPDVAQNVGY